MARRAPAPGERTRPHHGSPALAAGGAAPVAGAGSRPVRQHPPAGSTASTTPALADTAAEGLFVTPALAASLPALAPARPLQVAGACGLQPARRTLVLGPHLPGLAPGTPVQAIVTANPVFRALGVEAIVGQELLRSHRQLWRLDISPPTLTLQ